jgi:tRNA (mo5U34)-methyltransferase
MGRDEGATALADEVGSVGWYHTIELPGGVTTPGFLDTRPALARVPMPRLLAGRRCLDVGSCDGFWAFEMERRGAAEVVGIDLDDPARRDWPVLARGGDPDAWREDLGRALRTFGIASRALGSKVKRVDLSVYDLSPEAVGEFDFAFLGSLLVHLRDPAGALNAVRSVTTPGGRLLVNEAVSWSLTVLRPRSPVASLRVGNRPRWWTPNVAALKRLVEAAGFRVLASGGPYLVPFGASHPRRSLLGDGLRPSRIIGQAKLRLGSPHAWVLAERAVPEPS